MYIARNRRKTWKIPVWALVALALFTRLPLLTISLEEVDTANFVNALQYGYDVPLLRPHPPGYPVYIFLANVVNAVVGEPLVSLALLSAILGSLAVVPVFSLLCEFAGRRIALAGALVFIVNPLAWSFSEAGLTDIPGMFFVLMFVWLCYRARTSAGALFLSVIVASLAVGVRQANVCFLPLLVFPFAYRRIVFNERIGDLVFPAALLFAATTAAWVIPMIVAGSPNLAAFREALDKQWSTAVAIYDVWHLPSPWLLNATLRVERFFLAYLLTFAWTGDDAKTPATLLLVLPWVFGFALFIVNFRFSNARDLLLALWIATILYPILSIHFLARYGLAHVPGFLIACLTGYASLSALLRVPRRLELFAGLGTACTLVLYGIKYQPSVGTFEFTPPPGSAAGGAFVAAGIALLLYVRRVYQRRRQAETPSFRFHAVAAAMMILVVATRGYALASRAHVEKSPSHQMVELVKERFDTSRITVCWDNLTHSTFEALIPEVRPTGYGSVQSLYDAYHAGRTLLITDKCVWLATIKAKLGVSEVATFEGSSPLFAKAPAIRLYMSESPR